MAMPNNTFINQYIRDGQSAVISLKKIYDTMLVTEENDRNDISRIPLYDIFLKYREQFAQATQYYRMNTFYNYKPKLLSYDLYNTTELWVALLRINNMRNITEFTRPMIKIYNPTDVKELLQIFFKRDNK